MNSDYLEQATQSPRLEDSMQWINEWESFFVHGNYYDGECVVVCNEPENKHLIEFYSVYVLNSDNLPMHICDRTTERSALELVGKLIHDLHYFRYGQTTKSVEHTMNNIIFDGVRKYLSGPFKMRVPPTVIYLGKKEIKALALYSYDNLHRTMNDFDLVGLEAYNAMISGSTNLKFGGMRVVPVQRENWISYGVL